VAGDVLAGNDHTGLGNGRILCSNFRVGALRFAAAE